MTRSSYDTDTGEKVVDIFSDEDRSSAEHGLHLLRSDVQHVLYTVLLSEGISMTQLAEKLGKNISVISKQLDGNANLTLRTVSEIAGALGDRIRISSEKFDRLVLDYKAAPLYGEAYAFAQGCTNNYQVNVNIYFTGSAAAVASGLISQNRGSGNPKLSGMTSRLEACLEEQDRLAL